MSWGLIVVSLSYLVAVGYLGYRGYRGTRSATDYLLAGRRVHPYVMAMSYGSTFISTSAIVGFGGAAAVFGMGLLWLTFLNIFLGVFIASTVFGSRTRALGLRLDAHTFPEMNADRADVDADHPVHSFLHQQLRFLHKDRHYDPGSVISQH